MNFCIPSPDEWDPRSRVDLTFNLGDAIRYHREMTVPGIGGLTFVRQLSWAIMGIALSKENRSTNSPKANVIANAIEALGCKIEYYRATSEGKKYSFIGSRAFGKRDDISTFKHLRQSKNYVQNTYRQSIVSALTSLDFCESSRFNQMTLKKNGEELRKAFGSQPLEFHFHVKGKKTTTNCEEFLRNWVTTELNIDSEMEAKILTDSSFYDILSPQKATKKEKEIVWNRLLAVNEKPSYDKERRIHLIELMDSLMKEKKPSEEILCKRLEEKGFVSHSKQIQDALRFNDMRKAAIDVLRDCCNVIEQRNHTEISLKSCLNDKAVKNSYEILRDKSQDYHSKLYKSDGKSDDVPQSAMIFAKTFIDDPSKEKGIPFLIKQENGIIDIVGDNLRPLNLFEKFLERFSSQNTSNKSENEANNEKNADLASSESNWKLPRLDQWCKLWEDARVR